jgi:hypothetical protein
MPGVFSSFSSIDHLMKGKNCMPGILQSMQVAELWRSTVGWCGIKRRQSVVCLRVACKSEPFDTVRCAQSSRSPSAVEECRWGSDRLWRRKHKSQVGERLFISHYFDSRVENFVSSKLVLCLIGKEEWQTCPLLPTTSRVCCERHDMVCTVLFCQSGLVQL